MNKYIWCGLGLFAGAGVAFAASTLVAYSGKAAYVISLDKGHKIYDKTETRFFEDTYTQQLFKFTGHTSGAMDADGSSQDGVIEAYKTDKTMFDKLAWSKKVRGADFQIFGDELVQVTEYGCCDSPSFNRLFNRGTGNEVEAAQNETTLEFQVPNTHLSYRYLAAVADSKAPLKKGTKTYIGTVSYFDANQIKGRVRVYANLPEGWGAQFYETGPVLNPKDEQRNHTVTLWSADKVGDAVQAYNGFGITGKISYDNKDESFSIVITADQIDSKRSTATSDLELEFQ